MTRSAAPNVYKGFAMKIRCLPLAAVLVLAVAPFAVMSQASAPSVSAAPKPPSAKPGPRLLTPEESRESASTPGDVRPERQVAPQVSIPLGKKPPAPLKSDAGASRRKNGAPPGGIDDAAARCEAQVGEQVRAKCRDQLAREARARSPG
jgi:hypothetical protein